MFKNHNSSVYLLFLLTIPNLICPSPLHSTPLTANGTKKTFIYDKSQDLYIYFTIPAPTLSYPINLALELTSQTLPNVLELYEGTKEIIFPNGTTKSYKRVLNLLEKNGTAIIELSSYRQEDLHFGLIAKHDGKIKISVTASEMEERPVWKTIVFVIAGLVSIGVIIWLCCACMKHINECCDKISDCVEDSCFYIGSRLRRPCLKRRHRQTHAIPHEGAPRIILVASMPDPGRFRFENRLIPVLVDKLDKMKETLPDENNVAGIPEEFVCSVCMTRRKTMMFDPCKHICCCSVCSREIIILQKKCPLCREPINDVQAAI